ncbi:MAG: hypothetical protein M0P71_17425 [Melioribacteraceae bacterium]|nr:hypothetical protein [Melioribacteraceae bacterium]
MEKIIARQKETVNNFKIMFDKAVQANQEKDARRYCHSWIMESEKLDILEDINLIRQSHDIRG